MPARLRDIVRALEKLGGSVEKPNSGSHFKTYLNGKMYPLTCHNAERSEISDLYIKGLCRNLGIDYEAFKKML